MGPLLMTALTAFALVLHGYHPYAEDGGLYAAGIKKLLHPQLYPYQSEFVTEHLRFSLFAPLVAGLTRLTRLPLPWMLLVLHCATLWATFYAAWLLAGRCLGGFPARTGAIVLLACWMTLPVAGTSLTLMDPYLTARSFSTPLTLFAILGAVDVSTRSSWGSWVLCFVSLAAAFAMHPLMAAYGAAAVVLVLLSGLRHERKIFGSAFFVVVVFFGAALIQWSSTAEPAGYLRVALTRSYWFPAEWRWYERFGLAAPLLLLVVTFFWSERVGHTSVSRVLASMALVLGALSLTVAALFCRTVLQAHLIARLQPLRSFSVVYLVMVLLLGGWIGERWLQDGRWRWMLFVAIAAAPMYFTQRMIFPATAHVEMPWSVSHNGWMEAFAWIRKDTPVHAVFAMDPGYINAQGEDAQSFRANAERSALPDYSKDGGEASITPSLTGAWIVGQAAQANLDVETDEIRRNHLLPLGVTWVLLSPSAKTGFFCPYWNASVMVCRLR